MRFALEANAPSVVFPETVRSKFKTETSLWLMRNSLMSALVAEVCSESSSQKISIVDGS
jgi:hypothetical protein